MKKDLRTSLSFRVTVQFRRHIFRSVAFDRFPPSLRAAHRPSPNRCSSNEFFETGVWRECWVPGRGWMASIARGGLKAQGIQCFIHPALKMFAPACFCNRCKGHPCFCATSSLRLALFGSRDRAYSGGSPVRAQPVPENSDRFFRGLAPVVEDEEEERRSSSWKGRRGGPQSCLISAV